MIEPGLADELRLALPAPVQTYLGALETAVALLPTVQAELAMLRAEVAELRARLGQDSTNSSRPPSSDPPAAQATRATAAP
ncbi:MAG: hypothetical protein H0W81_13290, partial [Chloroflexi bacterium]|nr:hypothetical protein [Chloroflexota bacterium]